MRQSINRVWEKQLRLREVYRILDSISPFELQEKWDNSGLQVGDWEKEIENIYLCVDLDSKLIASLPKGSLLITHHPLIFSPLKSIVYDRYPAKLLVQLVQKDIALIAMHTNFDKTHLNKYVARKVLGVEPECEEFICTFKKEGSFEEIFEWVKEKFSLHCPRFVKAKDRIEKIALTTGSGGGLLDFVQADLFLTGDIKYHDAVKAQALGINMIDIGHFESEKFFAEALEEELKTKGIKAIIASIKNPLKA